ncbi:phage (Mu-like) virion morphogenesis protein [Vibrio variabilis]|uniref:Phage (Mu-like) virion morphogenesis protein n=1 Tax=Vibrio variabilis TaxID=990271 RepID=A0ABQ0JLS9_9VIBR|nr:phage (Mu-like) virion morphogenesis protein [Vibrio variabilis]
MSLLKDLHDALTDAVKDGTTITDFRKAFDKTVQSQGWSYNGKRGWRTRVIFNNNLTSAYSAGRWQQFERMKTKRPYLTYMTVGDDRVRDEHGQWRYLTLPIDDAFWDTHMPPNDFGCRCYVLNKSQKDIERENLTVQSSPTIKKQKESIPVQVRFMVKFLKALALGGTTMSVKCGWVQITLWVNTSHRCPPLHARWSFLKMTRTLLSSVGRLTPGLHLLLKGRHEAKQPVWVCSALGTCRIRRKVSDDIYGRLAS